MAVALPDVFVVKNNGYAYSMHNRGSSPLRFLALLKLSARCFVVWNKKKTWLLLYVS